MFKRKRLPWCVVLIFSVFSLKSSLGREDRRYASSVKRNCEIVLKANDLNIKIFSSSAYALSGGLAKSKACIESYHDCKQFMLEEGYFLSNCEAL